VIEIEQNAIAMHSIIVRTMVVTSFCWRQFRPSKHSLHRFQNKTGFFNWLRGWQLLFKRCMHKISQKKRVSTIQIVPGLLILIILS
jgi:hypothetical protein